MSNIRHHRKKKLYYRVFFLVVVLFLLFYTLLLTVEKLIANSTHLGLEMVSAFSSKAEYSIRSYNIALDFASTNLAQIMENNTNIEELKPWLKQLDYNLKNNLKVDSMHTEIIIDNKLVCLELNEIESFNDTHLKSIADESKVVEYNKVYFTNIYKDIYDKVDKLSIFKKIKVNNRDVIIVTDFPLKDLQIKWNHKDVGKEQYIYYLFDPEGRLVFTTYNKAHISNNMESFIHIKDEIDHMDNYEGILRHKELYNSKYNIFYVRNIDNGFLSIIAIPNKYISYATFKNIQVYIYIILALALFMLLFLMKDKKNNMKMDLFNDMVSIIGNSYYAIFSINIKKYKYEIIKGDSEIIQYLPDSGDYSRLHQLVCTVVEKGTQDDFSASFSLENIQKLIKTGKVDFGGDFRRILHDGYIWVNVKFIYDKEISEDYAVLCFKNRDEERKVELEHIEILESSIAAMKKSSKSKSIFYSALSHDMRTPLNAIIGLTNLIEADLKDSTKVLDYMDKIKVSGNQLLSLIDNFLDYTKETYDNTNDNVEFKLREYLDSVLDIYNILASRDKKHFHTAYHITNNNLIGDTAKLYRIVNNLIMNSFKYTKHGDSVSLEVIELQNQGSPKYQFIFKDTGIGMSKEFIEKIFSPYQREKRFETKESTGVGLGMAIVENYVRLLNGEIYIESELHKGTTITIILAFEHALEEEKEEDIDSNDNKNISIEGLSILVAEDNNINMFILTELLIRHGCKVAQAWNGKEVIDMFSSSDENTYDLILMDIQMPEVNGLEAAKEIRNMDRQDAKTIPIVAVSANVYTEDVAASNVAGMNAHLAKPINYTMLQKTIFSLIKDKN